MNLNLARNVLLLLGGLVAMAPTFAADDTSGSSGDSSTSPATTSQGKHAGGDSDTDKKAKKAREEAAFEKDPKLKDLIGKLDSDVARTETADSDSIDKINKELDKLSDEQEGDLRKSLDKLGDDNKSFDVLKAVLDAKGMSDKDLLAAKKALKDTDPKEKSVAIEKEIRKRAKNEFPREDPTQKKAFEMRHSLDGLSEADKKKAIEDLSKTAATDQQTNAAFREAFHGKGVDGPTSKMADEALKSSFKSETQSATKFKNLFDHEGTKFQAFQDKYTKKQFLAKCVGANCYSDMFSSYESAAKKDPAKASEDFFKAAKDAQLSFVTKDGKTYSFAGQDKAKGQILFVQTEEDGKTPIDSGTPDNKKLYGPAELGKMQKDGKIAAFTHSYNYYNWSSNTSDPKANKEQTVYFTNTSDFNLLDKDGKKVSDEKRQSKDGSPIDTALMTYDTRTGAYSFTPTEPVDNGGAYFTDPLAIINSNSSFWKWNPKSSATGSQSDSASFTDPKNNQWKISGAPAVATRSGGTTSGGLNVQYVPPPPPPPPPSRAYSYTDPNWYSNQGAIYYGGGGNVYNSANCST